MEKIALICDSSCDVSMELLEKYNINLLPFKIIYKDREYRDRIEISPSEVYNNLCNEVPTTSLPSIEDMDTTLKKLISEGYTHVIAITISSELSGTFNALNLISENYPELNIHIFDSKTLTMATGFIILRCASLVAQGLSFDEIVGNLHSMRKNVSVYYIIDTLEYLKKGGRIGKVSGTLCDLLNIKPIISVNDEGVYYTFAKIRGKKQGLSKLLNVAKKSLSESKCKIAILHGDSLDDSKNLLSQIQTLDNVTDTYFGEISPSLGVHTGPGLVGLIIEKDD